VLVALAAEVGAVREDDRMEGEAEEAWH